MQYPSLAEFLLAVASVPDLCHHARDQSEWLRQLHNQRAAIEIAVKESLSCCQNTEPINSGLNLKSEIIHRSLFIMDAQNNLNNSTHEVWYVSAWGLFHVITGIVFSLIFLIGALLLEDLKLLAYIICSAGLVYMGFVRLKKPYIRYSASKIELTGTFGEQLRSYEIKPGDETVVKHNRIYLNGSLLRFNNWFVKKAQYNKMLRFYNPDAASKDDVLD